MLARGAAFAANTLDGCDDHHHLRCGFGDGGDSSTGEATAGAPLISAPNEQGLTSHSGGRLDSPLGLTLGLLGLLRRGGGGGGSSGGLDSPLGLTLGLLGLLRRGGGGGGSSGGRLGLTLGGLLGLLRRGGGGGGSSGGDEELCSREGGRSRLGAGRYGLGDERCGLVEGPQNASSREDCGPVEERCRPLFLSSSRTLKTSRARGVAIACASSNASRSHTGSDGVHSGLRAEAPAEYEGRI